MNEWLKKYDLILNYFLEYRKTHPNFKFLTRMQNNQDRLKNGYWFQGTDHYIFVPLFRIGDSNNKTKTIGFVVKPNGHTIEIIFGNIENSTDADIQFHRDLVEYLRSLNIFRNVEESIDSKKFVFLFENNNLGENLKFYISDFYEKAYELLEQYGLTRKYVISEESFQKNIKRIMEIKNSGTNVATAEVENDLIETETKMYIRNIILYGVPGVGKTHNVAKLIGLIEEGKGEKEIFDAIQKNEPYEKETLEDMQERIAFVTFHQSFGYEDFIEGFRPNEEGKIELVDGIFKSLSLRAKENLKKSSTSSSFDFEQFLSDYVTYVESQEKFELDKDLYLEVLKKSNGDFLSFRTKGRVRKQSLTKNIILRDFEKFLNGEIKQYQDIKPTYESQSSYHGNAPYYFKLFENMKSFLEQQVEDNYQSVQEERKNYYLIIDEINRGNISKIFGELITLIEEDKRDTYEVTLPYSKEKFSVPSNLYIIGTMNSTDKSIALIDIALRRRFTFLKMQPNDGLVPEFSRDLFKSLNYKIKEKLGEEYRIGHSYFMNIADKDMLDFVLEYKIKPLLEEYFYGDEAGLKEVLSVIEERGE